jgi:hypothetical protein
MVDYIVLRSELLTFLKHPNKIASPKGLKIGLSWVFGMLKLLVSISFWK